MQDWPGRLARVIAKQTRCAMRLATAAAETAVGFPADLSTECR